MASYPANMFFIYFLIEYKKSLIKTYDRIQAVGPLPTDDKRWERIYNPSPLTQFFQVPTIKKGYWLAEHQEYSQTVPQFQSGDANVPNERRHTIYLLPLGNFIDGYSPPLTILQDNITVQVLPMVDISAERITTRINEYSNQKQMLVSDIFEVLKTRIPGDAYCLLGVTMIDLYPKPDWNFVFGQASLKNRYGVFSFARYNPEFYEEKLNTNDLLGILIKRSLRVCVHEIGHMFGVTHCIYYDCLMSGSNHLEESEAKPLHLCPVDLRKFQLVCNFNPVERYVQMLEFFRKFGDLFKDEITWTSSMLAYINVTKDRDVVMQD